MAIMTLLICSFYSLLPSNGIGVLTLPRNGSGTYSLPSPENPISVGSESSSTNMNTTLTDVGTALTNSLCANGEKVVTANQPMGNYVHTGVGNATARTNYAAAGQTQDGTLLWLGSVAGANTITASLTPVITAYATGQTFRFIPANTITAAATININSVGAKNIYKNASGGLVALVANDLIANNTYEITYDGTQFVVINISSYAQGADVASAGTINLDTATGDYIHVTGTTTITAVTLKQGQQKTLVFDGILTFTNGASLILPGGINITTAAGDTCILRGEASGVVRCVYYSQTVGSYTGTFTGFTTTPTITINYVRNGNIAILSYAGGGATATSNATTFTITGMPALIRPNTAVTGPTVYVKNNGSDADGALTINTNGTIAVRLGTGLSSNASGWTNSGTKGIAEFSICYPLS
jgi:hypothetical protein